MKKMAMVFVVAELFALALALPASAAPRHIPVLSPIGHVAWNTVKDCFGFKSDAAFAAVCTSQWLAQAADYSTTAKTFADCRTCFEGGALVYGSTHAWQPAMAWGGVNFLIDVAASEMKRHPGPHGILYDLSGAPMAWMAGAHARQAYATAQFYHELRLENALVIHGKEE